MKQGSILDNIVPAAGGRTSGFFRITALSAEDLAPMPGKCYCGNAFRDRAVGRSPRATLTSNAHRRGRTKFWCALTIGRTCIRSYGETISLDPSIGNWNFRCQSHYWIRRNRAIWAPRWSRKEIDAARAHDRRANTGGPD